MTPYTLFIDGRWTQAASGRRYDSVDPFLGQAWASAAGRGQRGDRARPGRG